VKVNAAAILRITKAAVMAEITPLLQEKMEIPHRLLTAIFLLGSTSDFLQLHSPLQGKMIKVGRSPKQLPIGDTKPHIQKILWELSKVLSRSAHMLLKQTYISQKTAWLCYLM